MFQVDLLAGKRILITGGGTGLGKSIGRRYVELGAELVICGRRLEKLEETRAEFEKNLGGKVSIHRCDVRDPDAVEAMMEEIWADGPLDVLVNNAAGNFIAQTDYELDGFPYPVIPFYVNCYGGQLLSTAAMVVNEGRPDISPPSPTPKRCFDLGRATAKFFADSPWRVALIASSSWSHGSLTAKHNRLYPDMSG